MVGRVEMRNLADDLCSAQATLTQLEMLDEVNNQRQLLLILSRCPHFVRTRWKKKALKVKSETERYPTFLDFVNFMDTISKEMNDPVYGDVLKTVSSSSKVRGSTALATATTPAPAAMSVRQVTPHQTFYCNYCKHQGHKMYECASFKELDIEARANFVRQNNICFNCLKKDHRVVNCRLSSFCKIKNCNRKHSSLLHKDPDECEVKTVVGNAVQGAQVGTTSNDEIYLPMVPVSVNDSNDKWALLDSGSTNSFISKDLAAQLKLKEKPVKYDMSTLNSKETVNSSLVDIMVRGYVAEDTYLLNNVIVVDQIPAKAPVHITDLVKYNHLKNVLNFKPGPGVHADILIGMDNAFLLRPLDVSASEDRNEPYAVLTSLGWSVCGPCGAYKGNRVFSHCVSIDRDVSRFWDIASNDDEKQAQSVHDDQVIKLWEEKVRRVDGHYELPIPWVKGHPEMPNNYFLALKRLEGLEKKLQKVELKDKYSEGINKLLLKEYAEPVPVCELGLKDHSVWYIPHHPVVSAAKNGKLRIVFDCAAKLGDVSLNNQCFQGPNLVNNLMHVLLRFRQYCYAVVADVEGMYLQVRIPPGDRNVLRFLWREDPHLPVEQYRMTSHLFGGVWCSASSTFALRKTVADFPCSDLVRKSIVRNMYVDDLLTSVPTFDEAREVVEGCRAVLKQGGFNLTKFMSNDSDLLQSVSSGDSTPDAKDITAEGNCRALGIRWDVSNDVFTYSSPDFGDTRYISKRVMLSQLSTIYDPLGIVAVVIHPGKVLFQSVTRIKMSWDEPVPPKIADEWRLWTNSLRFLSELRIPRCVCPSEFVDGVAELHTFSDASMSGYGAVCYLRVVNESGGVHVCLLASKSRLAPVKETTIPRLELCAAVLASELCHVVRQEMDFHFVYCTYWTDSKIALAYIRSKDRRFKVFVANRVAIIRRLSSVDEWKYVRSQENPADVLSRGCLSARIPPIWYDGPDYLACHKCDWPTDPSEVSNVQEDDLEVKHDHFPKGVSLVVETELINPIDRLIAHYSSFYSLKKAVAYLRRLVRPVGHGGCISVAELAASEELLIKHVQAREFASELVSLKGGAIVSSKSKIRDLHPILSARGIIVVGGRLKHSALAEESRHPSILPSNNKLTKMIILERHNETHLGVEWLLSELRRRYWILKARGIIKAVRYSCTVCRRLYSAPCQQKMSDLPPERVSGFTRCFSQTGVDLFGPFYVCQGRATVKRYGCLYTCFSTRAIHLEVLNALDTEAFLNGFVRFIARRGPPDKIFSDNGTNLVGSHRELRRHLKELDKAKVVQEARQREIEWVFNTPHASHHGGVWERLIRTTRRVLVTMLGRNVRLTDDVLRTVMCSAENIVNGRPLTKVSDDVGDDSALTPNHFLLLQDNKSLSLTVPFSGDMYRKKWRYAQTLIDGFWKRWSLEYMATLQRRVKWQVARNNLKVGDLVLVSDVETPRSLWPLARVVEVKMGRDGLVRSVLVKTRQSELKRPITKMIPLECSSLWED